MMAMVQIVQLDRRGSEAELERESGKRRGGPCSAVFYLKISITHDVTTNHISPREKQEAQASPVPYLKRWRL